MFGVCMIALVLIAPFFSATTVGAEAKRIVDLSCATNPGAYPFCKEGTSPAGLVNSFYKIGLGFAGAAALGVMLYGAILYTVSAGNASHQTDAKAWITGALWGLGLLLGAYLILYTINPQLVQIGATQDFLNITTTTVSAPPLSAASMPAVQPPAPTTAVTGALEPIPQWLSVASNACKQGATCTLEKSLVLQLTSLQNALRAFNLPSFQVTGATPPTENAHLPNSCHNRGTCADINFKDPAQAIPKNIAAMTQWGSSAGLNITYEVKTREEADRLTAGGARNVVVNKNASAPHFHVVGK